MVYLNHNDRFQRVLMAQSVFTLAECLVQFRDLIADAGGDTELIAPDQFEALLGRFHAIDPASTGEGGCWQQEFGSFMPTARKTWRQFWKT